MVAKWDQKTTVQQAVAAADWVAPKASRATHSAVAVAQEAVLRTCSALA